MSATQTPSPATSDAEGALTAGEPARVLLVTGLLGLAAAFALTVEKIALLRDPAYLPICNVNALLSCTSVMTSPQAEAFGFPNPLLGLVGFSVLTATGAALLAGAKLRAWFWTGLQIGLTAAFVFMHWLIIQSVFDIGALCPYCLLVWAATAPAFWYTTLRNLRALARSRSHPSLERAVRVLSEVHAVPLTIWYLTVLVIIAITFWDEALSLTR
ncbi:vitamin K epoxide reductase family protein [Kineococcus rubinsiae]|uniref:vitamin K epoxide reductase family protein n=1 Tax=Kineococcus rubinsiae TaxID=2609562 RepID=UPI0014315C8C|nr:vitamin K epoxide reductase family protein [Kineococcus rubinsiae]NIZ93175.1 vitamin K epoxide reductase family protein [Kineococcus rubinsiae]